MARHVIAVDPVSDLIAFAEPQSVADGQRDRRLRLAGQFARDHRRFLGHGSM